MFQNVTNIFSESSEDNDAFEKIFCRKINFTNGKKG